MKKFRLMAIVALLAVCANSFAQFTSGSGSSASANTDEWSTLWVQYNPSTFKVDMKGADDISFNGISLGYSKAFSLSQTTPLFLEAGAGLQYSFYSEDYEGYDNEGYYFEGERKFSMFSVKAPVNLTYKFDMSNGVSLCPFAGVTLRYNLSGKMKYEDEDGDGDDSNIFDKDDMGSKDATFKRFQIGWQIGVNAHIGDSFILGASYGTDFSEICKKAKISTVSLTAGLKF